MLGLAQAKLSCSNTSGSLRHFQIQAWEGGVTIKDVSELGRGGGGADAELSKRFPYKTGENGFHNEGQTIDKKFIRKDLVLLRCSYHANVEHSWLAPKFCSDCCRLFKVSIRCVFSWTQPKSWLSADARVLPVFYLSNLRGLVRYSSSVVVDDTPYFFLPSVPITCGVCVTKFWAEFRGFSFF